MAEITLAAKNDKQLIDTLTRSIYDILNPLEFVLLDQSVVEESSVGYRFRYGELIRKFRLIENKRFIEIYVFPTQHEVTVKFGIGNESYTLDDLKGSTGHFAIPTNINNVEKILIDILNLLITHASGFFRNDPEFWQLLEFRD